MKFIWLTIKKYLIPSEENNHHPISIRNYSLFSLTLILILLNLVLSPNFLSAIASNISVEGIIEATNQKRIEKGISPLIRNHLLEKAALAKLKDMFQKQYWDHYGPNGETPWIFIKETGYNYVIAGENLARDFVDLKDLINAWMNSPTHRMNILNKNYNETGIAIGTGNLQGRKTTLIVQLFGSRNRIDNEILSNQYPLRIEDYQPLISNPQNNKTFNNPKIQVSGESTLGDLVNAYVNNELVQTIPIIGNNFSTELTIKEGENNIVVQSKDSQSNKFSQLSNKVTVFLDTQPITLDKINLNIYFYKDKYVLIIDQIDDLKKITIQLNESEEKNFNLYGNLFITLIPQVTEKFTLNFYDQIDNKISKEYLKSELKVKPEQEVPSFILGYINTNDQYPKNSTNLNIFDNISNNPAKVINLFILFLLVLFILIDGVILIKKGQLRYNGSNHSINIPIIILSLFIVLFL